MPAASGSRHMKKAIGRQRLASNQSSGPISFHPSNNCDPSCSSKASQLHRLMIAAHAIQIDQTFEAQRAAHSIHAATFRDDELKSHMQRHPSTKTTISVQCRRVQTTIFQVTVPIFPAVQRENRCLAAAHAQAEFTQGTASLMQFKSTQAFEAQQAAHSIHAATFRDEELKPHMRRHPSTTKTISVQRSRVQTHHIPSDNGPYSQQCSVRIDALQRPMH
ncbi:hypothetical protein Dimus_020492 [Dionaea muscipula]